jgi:hypothetical protein
MKEAQLNWRLGTDEAMRFWHKGSDILDKACCSTILGFNYFFQFLY